VWELGLQLYGAIDFVLLALLTTRDTVGHYAFAYRLVSIPVFASTIITAAVYPALSAAARDDPAWFKKVLTNAGRVSFAVTAPMACGLAVLAPQVTDMISGGRYASSVVLVVILAFHIPAAALHTTMGTALFALDRQARMAKLAWGAVVLNVGANLIAIPLTDSLWGNGAIGAAVVTVATEAFVGWFVWSGVASLLDLGGFVNTLLRTLAATAVMGGAAWYAGQHYGVVAAVVTGVVVYAVSAEALKVLTLGDLRGLRGSGSRAPEPMLPGLRTSG
jgi:O-antigen/teichoic acid export membrane protein